METPICLLPHDILQHIQSLLDAKEAGRLATLSKQLFAAWYNRTKLEFYERHFRNADTFWEYARKTLQRYTFSNLKIHTFRLQVMDGRGIHKALNDLIVQATKLGAVNIAIEFWGRPWTFYLPEEVFSSKTVNSLIVRGGIYVFGEVEQPPSALQSLVLTPHGETCVGGDFMSNFLWRAPLLKELVCFGRFISFDKTQMGYGLHGLVTLTLEDVRNKDVVFFTEMTNIFPCLKSLSISYIHNCPNIRICSNSIDRITLDAADKSVHAAFDVPNLRKFTFHGAAFSQLKFESPTRDWVSDVHIPCLHGNQSWFASLKLLLQNMTGAKIYLSIYPRVGYTRYMCKFNFQGSIPYVERLDLRSEASCPGLADGLFKICRPKIFCIYTARPLGYVYKLDM